MPSIKKNKRNKDGRHPFKWLKYKGENVRIDADIASLVSNLWKLGIHTANSCQSQCSFDCGHKIKIHPKDKDGYTFCETIRGKNCGSHIWLVFEKAGDIEKFYNYVCEYAPYTDQDAMYNNILYRKKGSNEKWTIRSYIQNYGVVGHFGKRMTPNGKRRETVETWIEEGCRKNQFCLQPQLTFPRKHLEYVEKRIEKALEASNEET